MRARARVAVLLTGLVAVAACSGGGKQQVKADATTTSSASTTTTSSTSSTTSTSTTTVVAATSDASSSAAATTDAPTTSMFDPCWMSDSFPTCGPLVWSPPNAPLVIHASFPDTVPLGTPIDVVVSMHDDDDIPLDCGLIWGDDGISRNAVIGGKQCPSPTDCADNNFKYGTWPNTPGQGGDGTATLTYPGSSKTGTYSFYVDVQTAHASCGYSYGTLVSPDGHGSFATAHITITFV